MAAHQAALEALTRYFGYDSFRPGQQGIVEALLAGHDVLGVMPTGAGKSVCYQIPAALSPGVTLVVSPLISLMRDQVDALNDLGLPAAFINTTQTPDEQAMVFAQAAAGQIKLLYVAPERLETGRFRDFAARTPISLIAVDEAPRSTLPLNLTVSGQSRKAYVERGALFIGSAANRAFGVLWVCKFLW